MKIDSMWNISSSDKQIDFCIFSEAVDNKNDKVIDDLIKKSNILDTFFPFLLEGTFLHLVAKRGTIKTATKICQLGCNVNIQGRYNETPIFYAIKNSADMVKALIKNGADVNFRNIRGETPLHHAVRESAEVVKLLLRNGARADVVCKRNVSLLHESLHSGSEETVRIILNQILKENLDDYKQVETAEDTMRTILKNKSKLNIVEKDYPLLVLFAAKVGDVIFKMTLDDIGQCLSDKNLKTNESLHENVKYVSPDPKKLNCLGYFHRTALHYAVRKQLPEIVEFLLKAGADVNCKTKKGFTPLHYAAGLQNEEICEILLNYEANVNLNSSWNGSPLFQICGNKKSWFHMEINDDGYYCDEGFGSDCNESVFNLKIAKLLLLKGADPDDLEGNNKKPFLAACKGKNLDLCKLLFEFNANIKVKDTKGNLGLHIAAKKNCFEIVEFLLEKGLNVNERQTLLLRTPLLVNICNQPHCLQVLEHLIKHGANVNCQDYFGRTAVDYAIQYSSKVVNILLNNGAKVNYMSRNGVTPFHEALFSGSEETVLIILNKIMSDIQDNYEQIEKTEEILVTIWKYKTVLNIIQKDYSLLLLFAAKTGDESIFKLVVDKIKESLLSENENKCVKLTESDEQKEKFFLFEAINSKGHFDKTALQYAVEKELVEVVGFLVKAGANVNCKTERGVTPLHCAAALENEEICKILLSSGAEVNPDFPEGIGSPLDQVCDYNTLKEDLLGQRYGTDESKSENFLFNPVIAKLLLESGANPHATGSNYLTPFFRICDRGNLELMHILLQDTANLHIRDQEGKSVLNHAVQRNSLEMVDFLLKKGLEINIKNKHDFTAFSRASTEMLEYLVDRETHVIAKEYLKILALHSSSIRRSKDLVECLLELGVDAHSIYKHKLGYFLNFHESGKHVLSFIALKENELDYHVNSFDEQNIVLEHFEKSRLEAERLRSTYMIRGSKMTYYEFLTGTFYKAVQIAKNEEIRRIFRFQKYEKVFPCYAFFLKMRFNRVVTLEDAVDRTEIFLTKHFSVLPNLAIREILNFLCSSDFRKFGNVLLKKHGFVEEEANLLFGKNDRSGLVEIREDGIVVSFFPGKTLAFLPNSKMHFTNPYLHALDLKVGEVIPVESLGRHPESGLIRLTTGSWDDFEY